MCIRDRLYDATILLFLRQDISDNSDYYKKHIFDGLIHIRGNGGVIHLVVGCDRY